MFPHSQFPGVVSGTGGEGDGKIGETEGVEQLKGQIQYAANFGLDLFREAENVGVILSKTPDAHQTVENAAALVAVHGAEFGNSQGEFPVAAEGGAVHHNVEGTVHRLEEVFLFVHCQGGVHTFPVVVEMSAGLPEAGPADMGGIDDVVVVAIVKVAPVVFDQAADYAALGMPDDKAGADFLVDGKEAQLAA